MENIETSEMARIVDQVKGRVREHLRGLAAEDVVSLDRVEAIAGEFAQQVSEVVFEAWTATLEELAVTVGGLCTGCGGARKVKRRAGAPMTVSVLGLKVSVPKLYLACDCGQAGVSITRLLTGLKRVQSGSDPAEA